MPPLSGLKSLTREFSDETECYSLPSSNQTQRSFQRKSTNNAEATSSGSSILSNSGRAARLKAIEAALKETQEDVPVKRPSPTDDIPGPAKRRKSAEDYYEVDKGPPSVPSVSTKPKKAAGIFLSTEQRLILKLVKEGKSVFYTGSAGTGKSVLLREVITALKSKNSRYGDAVAITASTGIAACNIGGMTIHSFAGIGLGNENVEQLVKKIRKNKKAMMRWQRTRVLIIDEISMVDGELFDKLAKIARLLRKGDAPFGGIQLIVTGDFFQLPPVTSNGEPIFAFEAEHWKECVPLQYRLTKVFRQSDQTFVNMLNEMRFGKLTQTSINRFKQLSRPLNFDDGIDATELFPRRENVDNSNNTRNKALRGSTHQYNASDGGTIADTSTRDKLINNSLYARVLELKVGSQVMLIKNLDESLVNGSLGKVIRFDTPKTYQGGSTSDKENMGKDYKDDRYYPVVRFEGRGTYREMLVRPETWKSELPSGEIQASRTQLPLILAWAMSIHKSQGQTLERVKVDLGRVFERGQAYVALSRATSLEGLQVLGFDERKVMVHPKVVTWSETLNSVMDKMDN